MNTQWGLEKLLSFWGLCSLAFVWDGFAEAKGREGEQNRIYGGMRAGVQGTWGLFWPPSWQSLWAGVGLGRHRGRAVAATRVSRGTRQGCYPFT